jgi:hypothetical protein
VDDYCDQKERSLFLIKGAVSIFLVVGMLCAFVIFTARGQAKIKNETSYNADICFRGLPWEISAEDAMMRLQTDNPDATLYMQDKGMVLLSSDPLILGIW